MIHRWRVTLAVAVAATATAFSASAVPRAQATTVTARASSAALRGPVDYLLHAQNADGGLGAVPGQPSSPLFAGWAALGLESAGVRLESVDRGPGLIAYVERQAGATDAGSIERNILVAHAAGLSPSSFGGHDLVAMLRAKVRRDGSIGGQVNLTAFGVLALRAAGAPIPSRTLAWLESQGDRDGGYGFAGRGGASDVDDTGAALEALAGVHGRADGVRARAIAYVRRQQDRDGGFPSEPGEGSNAQSTAWVMQGLDAAGVDPASIHRGGRSPLEYLRSLIGPSGAVHYARGETQTPVWVTGEALMALAGKPLPLAPLPAAANGGGHAPRHHTPARSHPATHAHAPATPHRPRTQVTTSSSTTSAAPAHAPSGGGHGPASPDGANRSTASAAALRGGAASGSRLLIALGRAGGQTVTALHALM